MGENGDTHTQRFQHMNNWNGRTIVTYHPVSLYIVRSLSRSGCVGLYVQCIVWRAHTLFYILVLVLSAARGLLLSFQQWNIMYIFFFTSPWIVLFCVMREENESPFLADESVDSAIKGTTSMFFSLCPCIVTSELDQTLNVIQTYRFKMY